MNHQRINSVDSELKLSEVSSDNQDSGGLNRPCNDNNHCNDCGQSKNCLNCSINNSAQVYNTQGYLLNDNSDNLQNILNYNHSHQTSQHSNVSDANIQNRMQCSLENNNSIEDSSKGISVYDQNAYNINDELAESNTDSYFLCDDSNCDSIIDLTHSDNDHLANDNDDHVNPPYASDRDEEINRNAESDMSDIDDDGPNSDSDSSVLNYLLRGARMCGCDSPSCNTRMCEYVDEGDKPIDKVESNTVVVIDSDSDDNQNNKLLNIAVNCASKISSEVIQRKKDTLYTEGNASNKNTLKESNQNSMNKTSRKSLTTMVDTKFVNKKQKVDNTVGDNYDCNKKDFLCTENGTNSLTKEGFDTSIVDIPVPLATSTINNNNKDVTNFRKNEKIIKESHVVHNVKANNAFEVVGFNSVDNLTEVLNKDTKINLINILEGKESNSNTRRSSAKIIPKSNGHTKPPDAYSSDPETMITKAGANIDDSFKDIGSESIEQILEYLNSYNNTAKSFETTNTCKDVFSNDINIHTKIDQKLTSIIGNLLNSSTDCNLVKVCCDKISTTNAAAVDYSNRVSNITNNIKPTKEMSILISMLNSPCISSDIINTCNSKDVKSSYLEPMSTVRPNANNSKKIIESGLLNTFREENTKYDSINEELINAYGFAKGCTTDNSIKNIEKITANDFAKSPNISSYKKINKNGKTLHPKFHFTSEALTKNDGIHATVKGSETFENIENIKIITDTNENKNCGTSSSNSDSTYSCTEMLAWIDALLSDDDGECDNNCQKTDTVHLFTDNYSADKSTGDTSHGIDRTYPDDYLKVLNNCGLNWRSEMGDIVSNTNLNSTDVSVTESEGTGDITVFYKENVRKTYTNKKINSPYNKSNFNVKSKNTSNGIKKDEKAVGDDIVCTESTLKNNGYNSTESENCLDYSASKFGRGHRAFGFSDMIAEHRNVSNAFNDIDSSASNAFDVNLSDSEVIIENQRYKWGVLSSDTSEYTSVNKNVSQSSDQKNINKICDAFITDTCLPYASNKNSIPNDSTCLSDIIDNGNSLSKISNKIQTDMDNGRMVSLCNINHLKAKINKIRQIKRRKQLSPSHISKFKNFIKRVKRIYGNINRPHIPPTLLPNYHSAKTSRKRKKSKKQSVSKVKRLHKINEQITVISDSDSSDSFPLSVVASNCNKNDDNSKHCANDTRSDRKVLFSVNTYKNLGNNYTETFSTVMPNSHITDCELSKKRTSVTIDNDIINLNASGADVTKNKNVCMDRHGIVSVKDFESEKNDMNLPNTDTNNINKVENAGGKNIGACAGKNTDSLTLHAKVTCNSNSYLNYNYSNVPVTEKNNQTQITNDDIMESSATVMVENQYNATVRTNLSNSRLIARHKSQATNVIENIDPPAYVISDSDSDTCLNTPCIYSLDSKTPNNPKTNNSIENVAASTRRARSQSLDSSKFSLFKRKMPISSSCSSYNSYCSDNFDDPNDNGDDSDIECNNKIKKFVISKTKPRKRRQKKRQKSRNKVTHKKNFPNISTTSLNPQVIGFPKVLITNIVVACNDPSHNKGLDVQMFNNTVNCSLNKNLQAATDSQVSPTCNTKNDLEYLRHLFCTKEQNEKGDGNHTSCLDTKEKIKVTKTQTNINEDLESKQVETIVIDDDIITNSITNKSQSKLNKFRKPLDASSMQSQKSLDENKSIKPQNNSNVATINLDSDSDTEAVQPKKPKDVAVPLPKPGMRRLSVGNIQIAYPNVLPKNLKIKVVSVKRRVIDRSNGCPGIETIEIDDDGDDETHTGTVEQKKRLKENEDTCSETVNRKQALKDNIQSPNLLCDSLDASSEVNIGQERNACIVSDTPISGLFENTNNFDSDKVDVVTDTCKDYLKNVGEPPLENNANDDNILTVKNDNITTVTASSVIKNVSKSMTTFENNCDFSNGLETDINKIIRDLITHSKNKNVEVMSPNLENKVNLVNNTKCNCDEINKSLNHINEDSGHLNEIPAKHVNGETNVTNEANISKMVDDYILNDVAGKNIEMEKEFDDLVLSDENSNMTELLLSESQTDCTWNVHQKIKLGMHDLEKDTLLQVNNSCEEYFIQPDIEDEFDDDYDMVDEATQKLIETYANDSDQSNQVNEYIANYQNNVMFTKGYTKSYVGKQVYTYMSNEFQSTEECDPESYIEKEFVDYILNDKMDEFCELGDESLCHFSLDEETCSSSVVREIDNCIINNIFDKKSIEKSVTVASDGKYSHYLNVENELNFIGEDILDINIKETNKSPDTTGEHTAVNQVVNVFNNEVKKIGVAEDVCKEISNKNKRSKQLLLDTNKKVSLQKEIRESYYNQSQMIDNCVRISISKNTLMNPYDDYNNNHENQNNYGNDKKPNAKKNMNADRLGSISNADIDIERVDEKQYQEPKFALDLAKKPVEQRNLNVSDTPLDLSATRTDDKTNDFTREKAPEAHPNKLKFNIDKILNLIQTRIRNEEQRNAGHNRNNTAFLNTPNIVKNKRRLNCAITPNVLKASNVDGSRLRCTPDRGILNSVPPPIMVF